MIARSMRVGLAWLSMVALAGCKLGFDDVARPPSDGAGIDGIDGAMVGIDAPPIAGGTDLQLVVVSDEYGSDVIGTPIPGATVLVDRGAGLERSTTDAAGRAQFAAAGVVACHVVVKGELGWRVYTLVAPRAGTIELGGRPAANLSGNLTVTLPDDGVDNYTVRVLSHCATPPIYGGPRQLAISYDAHCEGQTGRAIAFAISAVAGTDTSRYVDAGDLALINGSTHTITGSYQPLPQYPVTVSQPPDGTSYVLTSIFERSGLDLVALAPISPSVTPKPGTDVTTIATGAAPGGNTLSVLIGNTLPLQYSSTSQIIVPATVSGPLKIEASTLLPLFQSLVLTRPPEVSWTGTGGRGTMLIVETITGNVQWDAYLGPSVSAVEFPALPADLGVTTPDHFDFASVVNLEVPGATRADLAPTIDRTWSLWPHDASLFPAAGTATARILYSAGLGPPIAPDAPTR